MTDPTEQPTPKRFLSHAFIPALGVCVLAAAALLYVTIGSGGKDFQVVAVNIDTTRLDKPKAFLNEVGVKALSFYSDPKADVFYRLKQAGKVVGLPTTVLIDRNGCEIGTLAGPALWDSPDGMALIEAAVKS